jgi:hypothetical protein
MSRRIKFPLKIQSLNQIRFHNLAARKANKTHLKTFPKKLLLQKLQINIAGSCFMGYEPDVTKETENNLTKKLST